MIQCTCQVAAGAPLGWLRSEHLPAAHTGFAATISGEGVARVDPRTPAKAGERLNFAVDIDGIQFFDPASGAAIWT